MSTVSIASWDLQLTTRPRACPKSPFSAPSPSPAKPGFHRAGVWRLAWACGQRRNAPATVLFLLEAERVAPEASGFNVARELLRECLKRERRSATAGLRGLAERVGILT